MNYIAPTPHTLKRLIVSFDAPISPKQISAFRGAIVNLIGRENSLLFHNHLGDKKFRYGYPLIQYKHLHQKPALVCVGEGVEEIHKFFQQEDWTINLAGETMQLRIAKLEMKELRLQMLENMRTYRIRYWVALNDEAKKRYENLDNLAERITMLEQILAGNIISMAKGINWQVPDRIECKVVDLGKHYFVPIKRVKKQVFNLTFKTNVFLPNDIGLGRHASLGFGTIWQVNPPRKFSKNSVKQYTKVES
ncbi:MAG: CRISPR-associated endonuclease Cas6 [Flammeovirgaceae bacterium]